MTDRHWWYSKKQHEIVRDLVSLRGYESACANVHILPNGRVATMSTATDTCSATFTDMEYLGVADEGSVRHVPVSEYVPE